MLKQKNKNILIVGAGIRGILLSILLKKKNKNVNITIIDKTSHVGGVLYSEKWDKFIIDKGIHLFENIDSEFSKIIKKILDNKYLKVNIKYGSYLKNKLSTEVAVLDFNTLQENDKNNIRKEFLKQKHLSKTKITSLIDYYQYYYGKTASKYLIASSKKYYAFDPAKLHKDNVKRSPFSRIRLFDDEKTRKLKNKKNIYDNLLAIPINKLHKNKINDLENITYRYFYPLRGGMKTFCKKSGDYLKKKNINFIGNVSIKKINKKKNKILCQFSNDNLNLYDKIYWTTDTKHLYNLINKNKINDDGIHRVPMIVYYFIVDNNYLCDLAFVHDFRKNTYGFRISNIGRLSKQVKSNKTVIDVEVPTSKNTKIWNHPEKFYDNIFNQVKKIGFYNGDKCYDKKFIKAPVSFRGLKDNYKYYEKKITNKIKNFSNNIEIVDQKESQLLKIFKTMKT